MHKRNYCGVIGNKLGPPRARGVPTQCTRVKEVLQGGGGEDLQGEAEEAEMQIYNVKEKMASYSKSGH